MKGRGSLPNNMEGMLLGKHVVRPNNMEGMLLGKEPNAITSLTFPWENVKKKKKI